MAQGESAELAVPRRHNVMVSVLDGLVRTAGHVVEPQRLAVFEHDGDALHLAADVDGARVALGGEPINELRRQLRAVRDEQPRGVGPGDRGFQRRDVRPG